MVLGEKIAGQSSSHDSIYLSFAAYSSLSIITLHIWARHFSLTDLKDFLNVYCIN